MLANRRSNLDVLRLILERQPGTCLIETDAHGVFTYFGPAAEEFFGCPASEAIGKLRYSDFHDQAELEECQGSPEFRAAIRDPGYTEDLWRVIPRSGNPFIARVTLVPLWNLDSPAETDKDKPIGWLALYQRVEPA